MVALFRPLADEGLCHVTGLGPTVTQVMIVPQRVGARRYSDDSTRVNPPLKHVGWDHVTKTPATWKSLKSLKIQSRPDFVTQTIALGTPRHDNK